jgi:hypothetical protein
MYILDCTNNQRSILFGYLLHQLVQDYQGPLMFSEVFMTEEADGVRDKESAYTTMFDVQTLLEACLNMSLRSICSLMKKPFAGKKQNIQS